MLNNIYGIILMSDLLNYEISLSNQKDLEEKGV